jgi:hypothetical protein
MPIAGITDDTFAMREIARIRKGEKVKKRTRSGRMVEVPTDLDHFRVDFRDDQQHHKMAFERHYGAEPKKINVKLAYNSIEASWFAWLTCYNRGGMLGMSDGERWFYLRDPKTLEVLISQYALTEYGKSREARLRKEFGPDFSLIEYDPETPVDSYALQSGDGDKAIFATPEGRLSLVIPELFGKYNMLVALTGSYLDIRTISGQLQHLNHKAEEHGYRLDEIPLVLERRQEKVRRVIDGDRVLVDAWVLNIHPLEEWGKLTAALEERKAYYDMLPESSIREDYDGLAAAIAPLDQKELTDLADRLLPHMVDLPDKEATGELPEGNDETEPQRGLVRKIARTSGLENEDVIEILNTSRVVNKDSDVRLLIQYAAMVAALLEQHDTSELFTAIYQADENFSADALLPDNTAKEESRPRSASQMIAYLRGLQSKLERENKTLDPDAAEGQKGLVRGGLSKLFGEYRHAVSEEVTGFASTKDMPDSWFLAWLEWLDYTHDGERWTFSPDTVDYVKQEASNLIASVITGQGQMSLQDTDGDSDEQAQSGVELSDGLVNYVLNNVDCQRDDVMAAMQSKHIAPTSNVNKIVTYVKLYMDNGRSISKADSLFESKNS